MTLDYRWPLLAAGCFALCSLGCGETTGDVGGGSGTGGVGGADASRQQIPGLWAGEGNGFEVCFYVHPDGQRLTASAECDLDSGSATGSYSFDLAADQVGVDQNGQTCSFNLGFSGDVAIDPDTNSFAVVGFRPPGEGVVVSFSGELIGNTSSGIARAGSGDAFCEVGWAAMPVAPCDDAAIDTCLLLLDCCESILTNPTFFQSCNSVVLECNQARCQALLDGYPQCLR
ncbi:MAG: hypothetical protein WCE62_10780 [Polyangiales bacterium]